MALTKHIQITQGSRFRLRWRLKEPDGSYINFSTWVLRGTLRRTYGGAVVATFLFALSDYTDTEPTTHPNATVEAYLLPSVTAGIDAGTYVYDIEYDPPAGANFTDKLWVGEANVSPEATK